MELNFFSDCNYCGLNKRQNDMYSKNMCNNCFIERYTEIKRKEDLNKYLLEMNKTLMEMNKNLKELNEILKTK